jgi:hypothetical protein
MISVHVDSFRQEPGETECLAVIWSRGSSCKECWVECYRRGWKKPRVDADNARLVRKRPRVVPPEGTAKDTREA